MRRVQHLVSIWERRDDDRRPVTKVAEHEIAPLQQLIMHYPHLLTPCEHKQSVLMNTPDNQDDVKIACALTEVAGLRATACRTTEQ